MFKVVSAAQMTTDKFFTYLDAEALVAVIKSLSENDGVQEFILADAARIALYANCGFAEGNAYLTQAGVPLF